MHALQVLDCHLALKIEYLAQRRLKKMLARNDAGLDIVDRTGLEIETLGRGRIRGSSEDM
jgi:hypothetical protein